MIVWNGHKGTVDASELGFLPGSWPLETTQPGPYECRYVFKRRELRRHTSVPGELEGAVYEAEGTGISLLVLND